MEEAVAKPAPGAGGGFQTRRAALGAALGGMALFGTVGQARAQSLSSSVDSVELQFALNMNYLVVNFLQVAIYGKDRRLAADLIRGGESTANLGVPVTTAQQVQFDRETRGIQARVREIADEGYWRVILLRNLLRADAPAQKTIDLSPEAFTRMFRLAGAIGAADIFDPYESVENLLLAGMALIDVQSSGIASLIATMENEIARSTMARLATSAGSNLATFRSMLYDEALAKPDLLVMADRIAAWRDRIDGTSVTDHPLSPIETSSGSQTRLSFTDANGLLSNRTPGQVLNVYFMAPGVVSSGGFFPDGINGQIQSSGT